MSCTWLIAEDDHDIRNLVAVLFRAWGYDPLVFDSGEHVWQWLDAVEKGEYGGPMPEFALMDIRMPGKKGTELAERMREIGQTQHLPIVLMTAYPSREVLARARELGIADILTKPFTTANVAPILQRVLFGWVIPEDEPAGEDQILL